MSDNWGNKFFDSLEEQKTAEVSDSALLPCYPTYFVKGKGLEGMTAQTLARELDIHMDRVEIALSSLIDKGLVRVIMPEDRK